MKKVIATILCFVYVAASSGATVNFHYCMGKFIGWDIDAATQHTCSNCGMAKEKKQGCCNDKQTAIQIEKYQLASVVNSTPLNNYFVYIHPQYFFLKENFNNADAVASHSIHGPPLISHGASYIFNCVYRI